MMARLRANLDEDLTPEQRGVLLDRIPELFTPLDGAFESEADRTAAWREHRDELLAEYVAENPGRRPDVWWELDAPEPRRLVDPDRLREHVEGRTRAGDDPRSPGWYVQQAQDWTGETYRGLPAGQAADGLHYDAGGVGFESESAYLDRLNLWLSYTEREDAAPDAFNALDKTDRR